MCLFLTVDVLCNNATFVPSDLYGAVGNPTKVGRTIVSGSQHETVSTILSVLSYFVQCTLVNDCVPVPEKLTPDVSRIVLFRWLVTLLLNHLLNISGLVAFPKKLWSLKSRFIIHRLSWHQA